MTTIFLFHRDLRLEDHHSLQEALNYAAKNKSLVLPVFIFTPQQVGSEAPIKSIKSIECMIQSLKELDEEFKLHFNSSICFDYEDNIKALSKIIKSYNVNAIFETKDYTPFAKKREQEITLLCKNNKIDFFAIDDLYLNAPGSITNKIGKVYQKFTPYYESAQALVVRKPTGKVTGNFVLFKDIVTINIDEIKEILLQNIDKAKNKESFYIGGRKEGLKFLNDLPLNYDKTRDIMVKETSGLSVHHHFGTVSIRETYYKALEEVKKGHEGLREFIRQLYWRDFYGQIFAFFEDLYGVNPIEFQKEWPELTSTQEKDFENWKSGTTGIDLIDAAMHQLNESGYQHNRARLLCASYLVKTMGIPWRLGERYYASKLLDYDITQNMCNWMLIASAKGLPFVEPPFRKHLPDSYSKRFDKNKEYTKYWL